MFLETFSLMTEVVRSTATKETSHQWLRWRRRMV